MHHRFAGLVGAVVTVVIAAVGCGTDSPATPTHTQRVTGSAAPHHVAAAVHRLGIGHVFLIVLENESYASTYVHNPNPYLKKLRREGTLLPHYYAIGHASNDNYIAMISGQAPNPATSFDCLRYTNFNNTKAKARLTKSGQAIGKGCVFPTNVKTLGNQLTTHHVSWAGYMEDMGNYPRREHARCGIPYLTSSGLDDTQSPKRGDQYAARHNPFVYFRSLIDTGLCRTHVVPLSKLPRELRHVGTTPRFSFITPNLCDDGHDLGCAGVDSLGRRTGGLRSVDDFLKVWIPRIKASPAYRKDGVIIITSDESSSTDTSSCCNERPGPNERKPGLGGPGGGRIGTLVLGRCVVPDATDTKHYNHYSLLRSLENLFGITSGGTDGKGHLGYAAATGLRPFGRDVFAGC